MLSAASSGQGVGSCSCWREDGHGPDLSLSGGILPLPFAALPPRGLVAASFVVQSWDSVLQGVDWRIGAPLGQRVVAVRPIGPADVDCIWAIGREAISRRSIAAGPGGSRPGGIAWSSAFGSGEGRASAARAFVVAPGAKRPQGHSC